MDCHCNQAIRNCSYYKDKKCIEQLNAGDKYTLEESKVTLYVQASGKACVIECDGKLYPNDSGPKKCDYLIKTENTLYCIELKSGNTEHAIEQLLSTLKLLENEHLQLISNCLIKCYIVSNKSLKISESYSDCKTLQRKLEAKNKNISTSGGKNEKYIQCIQIIRKANKSSQDGEKIIITPKNPLCI